MEIALKAMGYKTQVQPLSHFHDDYGLEGDDEDGEDEEMDVDGADSETSDDGGLSSDESGGSE
jgi:hypothetical protein